MHSSGFHLIKETRKPSLIVFDLDFTLWPFGVDKSTKSPFNISKKGNVIDSRGKVFKTFREVPQLLMALKENKYNLAVASRIEDIPGAYQLLHFFGLTHYFLFKEIYPGTKTKHFEALYIKSGIDYKNMLFFDDDKRNVRDISKLGVTVIQVPEDGISFSLVNSGLLAFSTNFK